MLAKLGATGPVIIEGSFHRNAAFCGLLAALRPGQPIHATDDPSGTARGAWLLARWDERPGWPNALAPPMPPWSVAGLARYRARWLDLATGGRLDRGGRGAYALINRFIGRPVADRGEKRLGARAVGRRPTIHDVARSAAVSPATVSNVLTGRRHVDPDLANRVRLVVDELGYQRDVAASALRSAKRNVVGASSRLGNPFFAEMVDRLEREARNAGRRLLVASSCGDPAEETRQVEALIAWRPAGGSRCRRRYFRRARGPGARGHPLRACSTGPLDDGARY